MEEEKNPSALICTFTNSNRVFTSHGSTVDFLFSEIQGTKAKQKLVLLSLFRKISCKEMNVQKFRNFVIIEFIKSGIYCICFLISGYINAISC